jgi:hypothetical protein
MMRSYVLLLAVVLYTANAFTLPKFVTQQRRGLQPLAYTSNGYTLTPDYDSLEARVLQKRDGKESARDEAVSEGKKERDEKKEKKEEMKETKSELKEVKSEEKGSTGAFQWSSNENPDVKVISIGGNVKEEMSAYAASLTKGAETAKAATIKPVPPPKPLTKVQRDRAAAVQLKADKAKAEQAKKEAPVASVHPDASADAMITAWLSGVKQPVIVAAVKDTQQTSTAMKLVDPAPSPSLLLEKDSLPVGFIGAILAAALSGGM